MNLNLQISSEVQKKGLIQKSFKGVIKRHPNGFGFFIPETPHIPDIFIEDISGIMTNDFVLVRVIGSRLWNNKKKRRKKQVRIKEDLNQAQKETNAEKRWFGEVVKILKRDKKVIVGHFIQQADQSGYLVDQDHDWGENLKIPYNKALNVRNNQLVCVKILQYPSSHQGFIGEVIQILEDNPSSDIKKVIFKCQIEDEFDFHIEKELSQIPDCVEAKDKKNRKDLTSLPFITIDGSSARDFDDAIYVEMTSNGFRVRIAISDVSYYVKPQTYIDKQAYRRGNSTYFPNYVIPMLPEKLSNGICSLNPNVERLAFVADLELNLEGEFVSFQFYEAVIKTFARTTYQEIQSMLDNHFESHRLSQIKQMLFNARDLTEILLSKRIAKHSLNLDLSETQITIDDAGYAVGIERVKRLFSHRIIEEMMLLANLSVADFLGAHKTPILYRVHEEPDNEQIDFLNHFLRYLGNRKNICQNNMNGQINQILKKFKSTQYEPILNIMVLRTMKQACYLAKNIGHFGLGFTHYTHFTSPIRRYSDLIIHRQLKHQLGLQSKSHNKEDNQAVLDSVGNHLSNCEQRSVKAERQFMAVKKARLMENLISQEFEGIITSITRFGVFVLLPELDVDGLLRLSDLEKGSFTFDSNYLYLCSCKTNKSYYLGDLINVIVDGVNIDSGKINFTLPLKSSVSGEKRHEYSRKQQKISKKHKKRC